MRKFKNRTKMRLRPDIVFIWILFLCSIFGTAALTIVILLGSNILKGIASVLLFLLGWVAAKQHNKL